MRSNYADLLKDLAIIEKTLGKTKQPDYIEIVEDISAAQEENDGKKYKLKVDELRTVVRKLKKETKKLKVPERRPKEDKDMNEIIDLGREQAQ